MQNSRTRGMTLIEAVVWIGIFTAVMLAIMSTVLYFYKSSSYALQEATAVTSAQRGLESLVRTLREAAYSSTGAYPVLSLGTNDIVFYSDIDGDPGIEKVHYFMSGTNLVRGIIEPTGDPAVYAGTEATSTLSELVRNLVDGVPLFTYYDKNGAVITDYTRIGAVRYVSITLLVDADKNRTPTVTTMRTSTALRNLIGH